MTAGEQRTIVYEYVMTSDRRLCTKSISRDMYIGML